MASSTGRESWGSRMGVILAVAGSAIGLGNFLRFPVQAAQNGGGAFMIPYFISLLLLGIPLMMVEWTLGRYGGLHGYGTAPSIFAVSSRNHFLKYFGVVGIFVPIVVFTYYTYVESWLLGFAVQSLFGSLMDAAAQGSAMKDFLLGYQGVVHNSWFGSIAPAYFFFVITFALNFFVVYKGIQDGIEVFAKIAMPILLLLGIAIMIRVVTLGSPLAAHPDWNVANGFGFLWNPDFSALKSSKVWMAAAGQIFFTLSLGMGIIITYASYLSRKNDITLSGLTAVSINECAEVILGGSIVIPAAFIFFGPTDISAVAHSGSFNLGFVTMPQIFAHMSFGGFFAFCWFAMLFLAGITSSVSQLQPMVAFVDDEFRIGRKKAVLAILGVTFLACQGVIFGMAHGVMDEMDFWAGTFALVVLATVEVIIFGWCFGGIERAWKETHFGADVRMPRFFKFVIKYITPSFLLILLVSWTIQMAIPTLRMEGVAPENRMWVMATRMALVGLLGLLSLLVYLAWRSRELPALDNEVDKELAS